MSDQLDHGMQAEIERLNKQLAHRSEEYEQALKSRAEALLKVMRLESRKTALETLLGDAQAQLHANDAPPKYYLSMTELSNALIEAGLNTERGPITVFLQEGKLTLLDFDGNPAGVIQGHKS